jgi:hypothetical protein
MFFRKKEAVANIEPEVAAAPSREKLGWFEKRDKRRRRRKVFEEVLGWILVPGLLYLAWKGVQAYGGVPKELRDFGSELVSIVLKGGR